MMRAAIVLLGIVFLVATRGDPAPADDGSAVSTAATEAGEHRAWDTADHVRVKAVNRESDGKDRIVVTVEIDAGFHINANPATYSYLIPTTLKVTNQPPLRVVYPPPVRFKPKFVDDMLDVYSGTVRITAEFPPGLLARTPYLFGSVTAQACTDEICLPPAELPLPKK
jgi:hypothetical protein